MFKKNYKGTTKSERSSSNRANQYISMVSLVGIYTPRILNDCLIKNNNKYTQKIRRTFTKSVYDRIQECLTFSLLLFHGNGRCSSVTVQTEITLVHGFVSVPRDISDLRAEKKMSRIIRVILLSYYNKTLTYVLSLARFCCYVIHSFYLV